MALLAPKSLDLGDGDALHPDTREGFAHLVELEWFDNRCNQFHGCLLSEVVFEGQHQAVTAGGLEKIFCHGAPISMDEPSKYA